MRIEANNILPSRILHMLALLSLLAFSSKARAFDEDHKVDLNGTSLHFRVRGTDKSHTYMLILHGGPGFSSHMFYAWGPNLEKTGNIVYFDQRGCGESAHLKFANPLSPTQEEVKGYNITNFLKDIEAVREYLKIDKWYVLGHSWGGMLGLEYAMEHPEHIIGYIHMDGLLSQPLMQNAILERAETKYRKDSDNKDAAKKKAPIFS